MLKGLTSYKFKGKTPTDLIVFLHGYGSSGSDLINLSQYMEDVFERPYFIAPNGPFQYEFVGASFPNEYQWYSLIERSREKLIEGSQIASKWLDPFLDSTLQQFNLTNKNLHLIGFSQGGMVALHTAFKRKDGGAKSVIGIGTTIVAPETLKDEIISKPKTCFIHGDADTIVPISLGKIAYQYALEAGVEAEFHKMPELGHFIDFNVIEVMKSFLKKNS